MKRLLMICTLAVAAGAAGCAGSSGAVDEGLDEDSAASEGRGGRGGRRQATVSVRYEATAKKNWTRGEEEFDDENYLAAQRFYQYIRSKFPYSSYATKAELRIADCFFERERFLEAIDGYQNFIRLHSTHKRVPYAMYRTGKSYHKQIPNDWFLLPPSQEKDQAAVRDATAALRAYVERFPNDENIEDGQKLLEDTRRRLMAHERYVADFYRNLEMPRAYVGRLEVIRVRFADVGLTDDLLFEIGEVYAELQDKARATGVADDLAAKFPKSSMLPRLRSLVAQIPDKPADDEADTSPPPTGADASPPPPKRPASQP